MLRHIRPITSNTSIIAVIVIIATLKCDAEVLISFFPVALFVLFCFVLFVRSFVRSFFRSFIRSFVRLSVSLGIHHLWAGGDHSRAAHGMQTCASRLGTSELNGTTDLARHACSFVLLLCLCFVFSSVHRCWNVLIVLVVLVLLVALG
jgi:hypothetical protein